MDRFVLRFSLDRDIPCYYNKIDIPKKNYKYLPTYLNTRSFTLLRTYCKDVFDAQVLYRFFFH